MKKLLFTIIASAMTLSANAQFFTSGTYRFTDDNSFTMTLDICDGGFVVCQANFNEEPDLLVDGNEGQWISYAELEETGNTNTRDGYYSFVGRDSVEYHIEWNDGYSYIVHGGSMKREVYMLGEETDPVMPTEETEEISIAETIDLLAESSESPVNCTDPIHVARRVESILQKMGGESYDEFEKAFLPFKMYKTLAKDTSISEFARERMLKLKKKEYRKNTEEEFLEFIQLEDKLQINWQDILAYEFTFESRSSDGMNGLEGTLYFSENDHGYQVRLSALLYEGEYHLLFIHHLERADK
jgi:hypothetical protein